MARKKKCKTPRIRNGHAAALRMTGGNSGQEVSVDARPKKFEDKRHKARAARVSPRRMALRED